MGITFLQLAQKVLQEAQEPLTPDEIWQRAVVKGYHNLVGSTGKTPVQTLGARLYVEVRDNPESNIGKTSTRPSRFFWKLSVHVSAAVEQAAQVVTPNAKQPSYLEKHLHPFMVYYGFHYLKAHFKTIRHVKSDKREFGEWVHPDIVGCYFPFDDWRHEVVELSNAMGSPSVKLYSFELKRELNFSNLREAFFQAVSNSSWANEGYLVAANILSNPEFLSELERLSAAFGIGVIQLDLADPDASSILFPALHRVALDWETINKLAAMNSDFQELLKRIKIDIHSREVRKELYDIVYSKEDLVKSLKQ